MRNVRFEWQLSATVQKSVAVIVNMRRYIQMIMSLQQCLIEWNILKCIVKVSMLKIQILPMSFSHEILILAKCMRIDKINWNPPADQVLFTD